MPRSIVHDKQASVMLAPGVRLERLEPGGRRGPNNEVLSLFPGGQTWSDAFMVGDQASDFQLLVPDIRLPANQYWPLHWHDCWIAVVVLDGTCLIGDWWMEPGDVLISAAGLEYGPLVIGPDGCQMFEVFARLHEQQGGYAPEYRDHPTLQDGTHVFKPREPVNHRNEGRMSLSCDGVEGLTKGRLVDGARWDLGDADDPERGIMGYSLLAPGLVIAEQSRDDWFSFFVLNGGLRLGGRDLAVGDVVIAEPGARIEAIEAGAQGAELFEVARTARGWQQAASWREAA